MTPGDDARQRLRHCVAGCARLAALLLTLLLIGCSGPVQPVEDPTFDNGGERAMRFALRAFARHRYAQAEKGFRLALELAYQRDDSRAVVDARYNLAASLAELGRYAEALRMLDATEAELRREGSPVTTDIVLLRASVNYRAARPLQAAALAQQVLAAPEVDPALAARAWFLRGLMAADDGDRAGLARALQALGPGAADARLQADRAELAGRLAGLEGRTASAMESLGDAARQRSELGDYRATSRALGMAGEIAMQAGQGRDAARFYLRAGRSAAAQGAALAAREWLRQARTLALQAGDRDSAEEAGAALAALEERS